MIRQLRFTILLVLIFGQFAAVANARPATARPVSAKPAGLMGGGCPATGDLKILFYPGSYFRPHKVATIADLKEMQQGQDSVFAAIKRALEAAQILPSVSVVVQRFGAIVPEYDEPKKGEIDGHPQEQVVLVVYFDPPEQGDLEYPAFEAALAALIADRDYLQNHWSDVPLPADWDLVKQRYASKQRGLMMRYSKILPEPGYQDGYKKLLNYATCIGAMYRSNPSAALLSAVTVLNNLWAELRLGQFIVGKGVYFQPLPAPAPAPGPAPKP